MKPGENKEETKEKFRWQIGIAIVLLIAVAAYLVKLISAQPEQDYKKSEKFTVRKVIHQQWKVINNRNELLTNRFP